MSCDRCFTYLNGQHPVLLPCSLAWPGSCQWPVADCTVDGDLQISSADYIYEDGKKVQSTRLPGNSGAGLDDAPEAVEELEDMDNERRITDSAENGHDLESVCVSKLSLVFVAAVKSVGVASACVVAMAVVPVGQIQSSGYVVSRVAPKISAPLTNLLTVVVHMLHEAIRVMALPDSHVSKLCHVMFAMLISSSWQAGPLARAFLAVLIVVSVSSSAHVQTGKVQAVILQDSPSSGHGCIESLPAQACDTISMACQAASVQQVCFVQLLKKHLVDLHPRQRRVMSKAGKLPLVVGTLLMNSGLSERYSLAS